MILYYWHLCSFTMTFDKTAHQCSNYMDLLSIQQKGVYEIIYLCIQSHQPKNHVRLLYFLTVQPQNIQIRSDSNSDS